MAQEEQKRPKYGFGHNEDHVFEDAFDSIEELITYAKEEWDAQNGEYFNDDDEYIIWIGTLTYPEPSDYAPDIDDIAEQIDDCFYNNSRVEDCGDVDIRRKDEAKAKWREFVNEYFCLPCQFYATWIGTYDLKAGHWVERFKKED